MGDFDHLRGLSHEEFMSILSNLQERVGQISYEDFMNLLSPHLSKVQFDIALVHPKISEQMNYAIRHSIQDIVDEVLFEDKKNADVADLVVVLSMNSVIEGAISGIINAMLDDVTKIFAERVKGEGNE